MHIFLGVNCPECETNLSLPSSAGVWNAQIFISNPAVRFHGMLFKNRNYFNLYLLLEFPFKISPTNHPVSFGTKVCGLNTTDIYFQNQSESYRDLEFSWR
jgi:hypothetical protein